MQLSNTPIFIATSYHLIVVVNVLRTCHGYSSQSDVFILTELFLLLSFSSLHFFQYMLHVYAHVGVKWLKAKSRYRYFILIIRITFQRIYFSYIYISKLSFFSYGILFGVGCAMVRETSTLMLSQYFKRRREIVEMIASTGTGFGIAIFSNVFRSGMR